MNPSLNESSPRVDNGVAETSRAGDQQLHGNTQAADELSSLHSTRVGAHRVKGPVKSKNSEKEAPTLRLAPSVSPPEYVPNRSTLEDAGSEVGVETTTSGATASTQARTSSQSTASIPTPTSVADGMNALPGNRKATNGPSSSTQIGAHQVTGPAPSKNSKKESPTLRLAPSVSPPEYVPNRSPLEDAGSEVGAETTTSSAMASTQARTSSQSTASIPTPTSVAAGMNTLPGNRKAATGSSSSTQIGAHQVTGPASSKNREKEAPTLQLARSVSPPPHVPEDVDSCVPEDVDSEVGSKTTASSAMASTQESSTTAFAQESSSQPQPPHSTAVAARGQSSPPPPVLSTAHAAPPGFTDMQPVVAEVVPDEEDIEKRIQREAERIAFRRGVEQRNPGATLSRYHDDTSTNNGTRDAFADDDTKTVRVSRRRCWIFVALIILVLAGAGVGLGIGLSGGGGGGGDSGGGGTTSRGVTAPPTASPISYCSLCADEASSSLGSVDLARRAFQFEQQTVTCLTFQTEAESIQSTDVSCPARQALAWKNCGCPTLPIHAPAQLGCTICEGGVETSLQNQQCANEEQYVRIVGSYMRDKCPSLIQEAVVMCSCPTEEELRFRDFQYVVEALVSDPTVFNDSTSYQSRALSWLAVEDPMQLDPMSSNDERTIQERFAVVALYYATNGPGWTRTNMGFLTGTSVCEWNSGASGVMCVGGTTVTAIGLSGNNLSGLLPEEIRALADLQVLDLASNRIAGSLPASIGTLTSVTNIGVSDNFFTNALPPSLFLLPSLVEIDITDNDFLGGIPDTFANATSLVDFYAGNNERLGGQIPKFLSESTTMDTFSAHNCGLSGRIPDFSSTATLRALIVGSNEITGTIPASLTQLRTMEILSVEDNKLVGSIPPFGGRFSAVLFFSASENELTGTIGDVFATLPPHRLTFFEARDNQFVGTIPTEIGNFGLLSHLRVSSNSLDGSIPSEFGRLTSLRSVCNLSLNQLTGTLPSELGRLSLLQNLFVRDNAFTGPLPSEIGEMTSLRVFEAASNFLSGTIPSQIRNIQTMSHFGVFENRDIYGDVGDVLNSFTSSLNVAFLGNLNLNGTLPTNVGRFTQMTNLRLQNNQVEGSIPDSFGLMTSLTTFQISGNKMNGTVPTDIGRLTRLLEFEMDQNRFMGPLPPQMSNLRSLSYADISENELTGSLAPLTGIGTLRTLLAYGNNFISIGGVCSTQRAWIRFAVNVCDSPSTITCTCCNQCCRTGSQSCTSV